MRRGLSIPLFAACALALAACNKPDSPENNTSGSHEVTLQLNLSFEGAMPESSLTRAGGTQVRHTLRFYRSNGAGAWQAAPEVEKVLFADRPGGMDVSVTLQTDRYKILAWTDYVQDSGADWQWYVRDFSRISLPEGAYQPGHSFRDAFCGSLEKDLGTAGTYASGSLRMTRPVSAYSLIATDADAFQGKDIRVTVTYPEPLATAYNLWEQAAVSPREGLSFTVPAEIQADGTVLLAQDMLLTGGDNGTVKPEILLQDASGKAISRLKLEIPLKKGQRTIVKGRFFTENGEAGITTDTAFDGEYEISF